MRPLEVAGWSAPTKLAAFGAVVALVAAGAFGIGSALDPLVANTSTGHEDERGAPDEGRGEAAGMAGMDMSTMVSGLAVTERGYTLAPQTTTLEAGRPGPFAFTVTGPDGEPVADFLPTHEKELHLIVVGRDLRSFEHVHPTRDADGVWSIPLELPEAGAYRVFTDFAPQELGGDTVTLGTDLFAAGDFEPAQLPAPSRTSVVDAYEVTLQGEMQAGRESELTFTVTRDGEPVADIEPYLGAFGHLVSLRVGDLAYLHTHPVVEAAEGSAGGPEITFGTTFPSGGSYRLFLDFLHGGEVHTASFTVDVEVPDESTESGEPAMGSGGDHADNH